MGRRKLSRGEFDHLRKLLGVRGRKPRPPRPPQTAGAVAGGVACEPPRPVPSEKQRRVDELRREIQKRADAQKGKPRPVKRTSPRFRAMTDNERALAAALSRVTFAVASYAKRFARDIGSEARSEFPLISNGQANYLRNLVHRYRRQINPSSLPPEERHLLVDAKKKRTKAGDTHV